jgi:hypothetical protein
MSMHVDIALTISSRDFEVKVLHLMAFEVEVENLVGTVNEPVQSLNIMHA